MTHSPAPVIVAGLRTPIGTAGHAFADVRAEDLAAPVLAALAGEVPRYAGRVEEVLLGNCTGPGGNLARVAALTAGLGDAVPALTVDRQCASGLAAVSLAADLVRSGAAAVLAGGVESASTAPLRAWRPTAGRSEPVPYTRAPFAPADRDPEMGPANDAFARRHGITRERSDAYAARSHALTVATAAAGGFDAEIVPVAGVLADERPRPGFTTQRLARLRPAFGRAEDGSSVTAGNACGINDGAAAVLVVPGDSHAAAGGPGLEVLASATTAHDPTEPGAGLVAASQLALSRAGLHLDDVDVIEFNEAFAGQVLACCDLLGLDPERVCRQGGALALGHPWGASGAVLAVRLFHQLAGTPGGPVWPRSPPVAGRVSRWWSGRGDPLRCA